MQSNSITRINSCLKAKQTILYQVNDIVLGSSLMAQAPQPSVVFSLFRYKTDGRAFVTSTAITEEEHLHAHSIAKRLTFLQEGNYFWCALCSYRATHSTVQHLAQ